MNAAEAHPPTHVLADLAEGVLDDAQAREVQAHADHCLTCQATLDELARVTVALRALPAELPVPEFVAARISHALAAERASGPGAEAAAASADAEGGTVAWFRRRLPQGIAAAASVAVLGLAGYVAIGGGGSGGDDSGGDTVAADAPEQADEAVPFDTSPGDSRQLTQDPTYGNSPSDPAGPANETTTPPPIDPARLTAAVEDVVEGREGPVNDTCGEPLSEEVGLPVLGSTWVGSGVLVVLDDAATYDGWLINTCGSTSNETMAPQVEVPKSE